MLTNEELWRHDGLSEDNLDTAYTEPANPNPINIESDESDNIPLRQKSPRKITPSELHFTIGDKTTKIIANKRNIARKTITRKAKEPRPTLSPQWNIIPDGTITNYTPHTITVDTPLRKNTVIRKNDIAIATETKPRLIHMVACKTVGEYKRNQEKIKKLCLEETRNNAKQQKSEMPGNSKRTQENIKQLAHSNQRQQQRGSKRRPTSSSPTANKSAKRRTSTTKSPPKTPAKKKTRQQPSFNTMAQQAAINYSPESNNSKQKAHNKSVHFIDDTESNGTVVYNIDSDPDTTLPFKIIASSSDKIFTQSSTLPTDETQYTNAEEEQIPECPISIIPAPQKNADEQQIHMDQPSTVSPPTQTQPGVVFLESPYGENNPASENNIIQADDINNATLTATIHVDQECPSAPIHELSSQRDDGAPSLYT